MKINYIIIPGLKFRVKTKARDGADKVFTIINEYFNVNEQKLIGKGRKRDITTPRFLAMFFLNQYYGLNMVQIGKIFKRDHTTVIHAIKTVRDLYQTDDEYKYHFKKLELLLY